MGQMGQAGQAGQAAWTKNARGLINDQAQSPFRRGAGLNMSTTVKQQIRDAVLASLEQLKTSNGVREVSRHRDIIGTASLLPALLYVDTGETEITRDATGQTYEFDFYIKVLVERANNSDARKDELVGAVQRTLENLTTLTGVATIKCGGEEKT